MAERITLAELDIDVDAILQKQGEYLLQIQELRQANSNLKENMGDLTDATEEQAQAYAANDAQLKKLNTEYSRNKAFLSEATNGVNGLSDAMGKENKTIDDARKNNSELIKLRSKVNATTKEGQAAIVEINKKIDQNNSFIKENVSQLEKQKINIGNYASALDAVAPGLGSFISGLQASATSAKTATQASNFLRVALIALPFLAIVAAISTLIKAFASTQKGMDAINRLLAPLKGGFDSLIGVIQDISTNIFDQLGDRFTIASGKIQQGLTLIQIGWAKVSGNTEKAAELLTEYDNRAKDITDAQERINKKTEDFRNILSGAVDRMKEGAETQKEIERLTIAIERAQIAAVVPLEKARLAYRELDGISKDTSRTEEERLKALDEAEKQLQFIIKTEQDINALKVKRLELSQTLNDTDRAGELELQELIAEGIGVQEEYQKALNKIIALRSSIQSKAANDAVKGAQNELKEEIKSLKEIEDEKRSIDEKRKLEDLIAFEEKLNTLRGQSDSELLIYKAKLDRQQQLDKEKAIAEIEDKELLDRKLKVIDDQYSQYRIDLEKQVQREKLAATAQLFSSIGTLVNKNSAAGKALAIAQTTIETFLGAQRAFSQTPGEIFIKSAAAAAAVAQGLARVGAISNVKLPRFKDGTERFIGVGTDTSDSNLALLSVNERVMSAKHNRAIGFNMSNDELVRAAQFYKTYHSNSTINDARIVGAINQTTATIARKKYPGINITKDGLVKVVSDGQNTQKYVNQTYLS
jgi:hypothetical protein